ncbi:hypothetical protein OH76DRAFT_462223 [Lentinus brumalis]|uniref:Uncharacterized protein n=1 Tax=Lentinus brumalis TaxID=2498619 RepID=A0A371DCD8_9APHY|nr:hypothetical protein OH76DRAFT_462223 [Polyporus brumalis]
MGRSAKFHKRPKTTSSAGSSSVPQPAPKAKAPPAAPAIREQKKRAGLKAKTSKHKREGDGPVLGGADYVELMFGSRRRAAAEAAKLPKDPDA